MIEQQSLAACARYFGPGRVVECTSDGTVKVELTRSLDAVSTVWARKAVSESLQAGDEVLVCGNDHDDMYITGVLNLNSPHEPSTDRGPAAYTTLSAEGAIQVSSSDRQLIFEYDPHLRKTRLSVPEGDLEITTPKGSITFRSAGRIRFLGPAIEMISSTSIALAISDSIGRTMSRFGLARKRVACEADNLKLQAKRGRLAIDDAELKASNVTVNAGRAKITIGRLETWSQCVIDRAKEVYRTVEGLAQLCAGRVRTQVDESFHLTAERTVVKAKKEVSIDGEKIELG